MSLEKFWNQTASSQFGKIENKNWSNWLAFISLSVFEVFDLQVSFTFCGNFLIRHNCGLSALYSQNTVSIAFSLSKGLLKFVAFACNGPLNQS